MLFHFDGPAFGSPSASQASDPALSQVNPYALILLLCGSSLACGIVCCVADVGHSRTHNTVFWLKLVFLTYLSQLVYIGTFVFPTTVPHCRVWTLLSWIVFQLCRKSIQAVLCFRKPRVFLSFGLGSSNPPKTVRFAYASCLFGTLISSVFLICSFWRVHVVLLDSDMWQDFPLWRNDAVCATSLHLDFTEKMALFVVLFWSDALMAMSALVHNGRKCWKRRLSKLALESVSLEDSIPHEISGYMRQFESDWWRRRPRSSFSVGAPFAHPSQDVTHQKPTTDLLTVRTLYSEDTTPCALLWLVSLVNLSLFVLVPRYTLHILLWDATAKLCVSSVIIIRSFIQYTPAWADGEAPMFDIRSHYFSGRTSECGSTDFSESDMIAEFGVGDRVGVFSEEESTMYYPHEESVARHHASVSEEYESFNSVVAAARSGQANFFLQRRTSSLGTTDYPCMFGEFDVDGEEMDQEEEE